MLTLLALLAGFAGAAPGPSSGSQAAGGNPVHVRAIQPQIYPNWLLACDEPTFVRARVVLDVSLDSEGRLVREPAAMRPGNTPGYADALARARTAVIRSAPFRMPREFEGGEFRLVFSAQRACANR